MSGSDNGARLTELKSALRTKISENDQIAENFKIEDNGGVVVTPEQRDAFRANLRDINEIKSLISDVEEQESAREYGEERPGSVATKADAARRLQEQGFVLAKRPDEVKSLGERFVDSEEFKSLQASGSATMPKAWEVNEADMPGANLERKDVYGGLAPAATDRGFGRTQWDPMVPRQMRTTRVRDLFPVVRTNANLIDYYRVTGFTEGDVVGANGGAGAASPVPDRTGDNSNFGLKPQSNLNFELGQAPVRTLAHFEVAHRNVLSDEPQLQGIINNELLYGLRLEEDDQILNGDGTGENLTGLLTQTGVQVYNQGTTDATETKLDALRRAATRVILAYYEATGFVLHPYDWEDIELTKDAQDRYILVTNVAIGGEKRVWRQPVVETPAMPQGKYLTGAWGLGAQLYDREQSNIRIAEQHSDFFIRNAVAILAEQRLAFAVKRPESFVKGDFS